MRGGRVKLERKIDELAAQLSGQTQDFLAEMIRCPSTQGHEQDCQALVAERFSELGLEVEQVPIPDSLVSDPEYTQGEHQTSYAGRHNVLVNVPGAGGGRSLILNAHTDVVPADSWPEAFKPRVADGVVTGRGAGDDKGAVAALYLAHAILARLGLPLGGDLLTQLVIEEEVGGNGALALIRQGYRADAALVVEVTDLALHSANRGAVWFRIDIEGRACHMARIYEGVSAIEQAIEAIGILKAYEADLVRRSAGHKLFAAYRQPVQVNVGKMRAGEWPSMVPGRAVLEGGVGFLPGTTLADVKRELADRLDGGGEWLRQHYRLSFPGLHNDAFETPLDAPIVKAAQRALKSAGLTAEATGWVSSCDARLFARLAGMPVVVFGPGKLELAHSDREEVRMEDIATAAGTLVRLVLDWCGKTTR